MYELCLSFCCYHFSVKRFVCHMGFIAWSVLFLTSKWTKSTFGDRVPSGRNGARRLNEPSLRNLAQPTPLFVCTNDVHSVGLQWAYKQTAFRSRVIVAHAQHFIAVIHVINICTKAPKRHGGNVFLLSRGPTSWTPTWLSRTPKYYVGSRNNT